MSKNFWKRISRPAGKALMVGAAGVLSFTSAAVIAQAQTPKKGGTLVIGLETDLLGFNPLKAKVMSESETAVAVTIMERGGEFNNDGIVRPVLLHAGKKSDDGKTWTYKIRKGVKWHDGSEFTADDFVAYFKLLLNPKSRYFGRLFMVHMKDVTKVDNETVQIHLRFNFLPQSYSGAAFSFTTFVGSMKQIAAKKQHRKPIGTGRFVFKEWRAGDRLVVEKNPDHWDAQNTYLDKIIYRFLPDQQTRLAALQSGEVDIIWTDRGASILAARKDKNLVVKSHYGKGNGLILLNNAKPPFNDINARRAFSHARSQKIWLKVGLRGVKPFTTHPFGPHASCDAGYREHSIKQARKYAKLYETKHGKKIEFDIIHTATQRGKESAEILRQLSKRAGLKANLKPVDQLQLIQRVFTNNYNVSGWRIADSPQVVTQLYALLNSKSFYNLTKYKNPEMDKMLLPMVAAPNRDVFEKARCAVARKMNDEAPILLSSGNRHHAIYRKGVVHNVPTLWQGVIDARQVWVTK